MGTSKSTAEFARKIHELTKVPARVEKLAVRSNARTAKGNAENAVRAATGGSAKLRNAGALVRAPGVSRVVGTKGAKLTVSSKLATSGNAATVKAVGPWQLIEYPTKQHFIGPAGLAKVTKGSKSGRSTAKARDGRATAVKTPYGLKRFVYVKGTRGKFPWKKAREKTEREAPLAVKKFAAAEMAKVFR